MRRYLDLILVSLMLSCNLKATPQPIVDRAPTTIADTQAGEATAKPAPTSISRPTATGLTTELVADGLQLPVNLAFAPDGRLFLTEVSRGAIRVIEHGQLVPEPVALLDVANDGEQGLLGMSLDPSFNSNHYLYVFYSEPRDGKGWRNRVVRLTESSNRAAEPRVVLDDLPINNHFHNGSHNGGRLGFGPDGKLFVTIGDLGQGLTARDMKTLAGKLLRVNPDGSIPADNPFTGSPVYALGLRNSYGLTFHPQSGVPYLTDNGPDGHDEVNRIVQGGNYGSPEVNGIRHNPRFMDPIWESQAERGGIAGIAFYTGSLFPQFQNDLLFCTFTSGRLTRLRLGGSQLDQVLAEETLSNQCNLDVISGLDGAVYFTSINQVLRLIPGS